MVVNMESPEIKKDSKIFQTRYKWVSATMPTNPNNLQFSPKYSRTYAKLGNELIYPQSSLRMVYEEVDKNAETARIDYCQYLLSTPMNYTLTPFAEHSESFSHDQINWYFPKDRLTPKHVWWHSRPKRRVKPFTKSNMVYSPSISVSNSNHPHSNLRLRKSQVQLETTPILIGSKDKLAYCSRPTYAEWHQ